LSNAERGRPEWSPDHVAALLTSKAVAFYDTSALHFVSAIRDDELRQLAVVELYGRLPVEAVSRLGGVQQEILQAIALVRLSAREADPNHQQELLGQAFAQAEASLEHVSGQFAMDLVLEFARESVRVDAERAEQFSRQVIGRVLGSLHDWAAHRLYELADCGYVVSAEDRAAFGRLSDQWVDKLEHPRLPDGRSMRDEDAHRLAAKYLAQVARSTLLADRERGLMLLERAARHALVVSETSARLTLQRGILRALLANGEAALWEEAVQRSLDYGDIIFLMFDRFSRTLLERRKDDVTAALSVLEVIDWAEQLTRTGLRGGV
jgi:hypothetical protein